ncbi:MAG: hypothetical protein WCA27_07300 [Candidatus Sulfotelmatobacter sp.]
MNSKALKKIEGMLAEAAARRTWGEIQIDLKDGKAILIRQIIQTKINEEYPGASTVNPTSAH